MPRPKFDPTINLGHVFTILALIGSVFFAYSSLLRELDNHEFRIVTIEKRADTDKAFQQQILTTLGTIREDIATLKERSERR